VDRLRRLSRHQAVDLALLIVGISAPIGLLLVNSAAYVMSHLDKFRLSIGIAAVLSSLALSGLTAHTVLGRVAAYVPELYARYRVWMIGAAAVSVVAWSLFGGWGAYQSLSDARHLPNLAVTLTALWLLALPFAMNFFSGWLRRRREAAGAAGSPGPAGLPEAADSPGAAGLPGAAGSAGAAEAQPAAPEAKPAAPDLRPGRD